MQQRQQVAAATVRVGDLAVIFREPEAVVRVDRSAGRVTLIGDGTSLSCAEDTLVTIERTLRGGGPETSR